MVSVKKEQKINYYQVGFWIALGIIIFLGYRLSEWQEFNDKNVDDCVKYLNVTNKFIEKTSFLYNETLSLKIAETEWNLLSVMKDTGDDFIKDDVIDMVREEYIKNANIVKPKIKEANDFIIKNEEILTELGYDVPASIENLELLTKSIDDKIISTNKK